MGPPGAAEGKLFWSRLRMPFELVDGRGEAGERAPSIGGYESFLDSGASVCGSNYSSAAEQADGDEHGFHMLPEEW